MPAKSSSKDFMFSQILQWRNSGISQKEFCRQQNIAMHKFYYYFRKFRDQELPTEHLSGFVPLEVKASGTEGLFASIDFPDGRRITLHQAVDSDYLIALLGH